MTSVLLLPPLAFLIILLVMLFLFRVSAALGFRGGEVTPGGRQAYACGEDVKDHHVRPDYTQFFAFAFFFTIMHVVAMMVATLPVGFMDISLVALAYIGSAIVAMSVLFRR